MPNMSTYVSTQNAAAIAKYKAILGWGGNKGHSIKGQREANSNEAILKVLYRVMKHIYIHTTYLLGYI